MQLLVACILYSGAPRRGGMCYRIYVVYPTAELHHQYEQHGTAQLHRKVLNFGKDENQLEFDRRLTSLDNGWSNTTKLGISIKQPPWGANTGNEDPGRHLPFNKKMVSIFD
ncbi:hypothetical protein EDD85DRAFT_794476 [Armillaria nabsnona]|nr:hypothetical protein EDD85DRAFT_794476 [Armillaria nabsnona]